MNKIPALMISVAAAAVLALVLALVLRQPLTQTMETPDSGLSIQIYEVPTEHEERIRDSLRAVLFSNSDKRTPIGHASIPMPGRLVVLAPDSLHGSIQATVETLSAGVIRVASSDSAINAPERVRMELWLARVVPDDQSIAPELASVAPALDVLRSVLGDSGYAFVDRSFALARTDGTSVSLAGSKVKGDVRLRAGESSFDAKLALRAPDLQVDGFIVIDVDLPEGVPQVISLFSGRHSETEERSEYVLILVAHTVDA